MVNAYYAAALQSFEKSGAMAPSSVILRSSPLPSMSNRRLGLRVWLSVICVLSLCAPLLAQAAQQSTVSGGADNSRILPQTGAANIRYQQPVGGKGEADLGFRSVPKPEGWSQDLQAMCRIRQQSWQTVLDVALENLDPTNPEGSASHPPLDRI